MRSEETQRERIPPSDEEGGGFFEEPEISRITEKRSTVFQAKQANTGMDLTTPTDISRRTTPEMVKVNWLLRKMVRHLKSTTKKEVGLSYLGGGSLGDLIREGRLERVVGRVDDRFIRGGLRPTQKGWGARENWRCLSYETSR